MRGSQHFRAEPALAEDSLLVAGARARDYEAFLAHLDALLAHCEPEACQAYVLVIPHVVQVDETRIAGMEALGARFTEPARLRLPEYPFVRRLRQHVATRPGVRVLDPLSALRRAAAAGPVYYPADEHLNPRGQETIAEFLIDELDLE